MKWGTNLVVAEPYGGFWSGPPSLGTMTTFIPTNQKTKMLYQYINQTWLFGLCYIVKCSLYLIGYIVKCIFSEWNLELGM